VFVYCLLRCLSSEVNKKIQAEKVCEDFRK
jgi:hypothetical protein